MDMPPIHVKDELPDDEDVSVYPENNTFCTKTLVQKTIPDFFHADKESVESPSEVLSRCSQDSSSSSIQVYVGSPKDDRSWDIEASHQAEHSRITGRRKHFVTYRSSEDEHTIRNNGRSDVKHDIESVVKKQPESPNKHFKEIPKSSITYPSLVTRQTLNDIDQLVKNLFPKDKSKASTYKQVLTNYINQLLQESESRRSSKTSSQSSKNSAHVIDSQEEPVFREIGSDPSSSDEDISSQERGKKDDKTARANKPDNLAEFGKSLKKKLRDLKTVMQRDELIGLNKENEHPKEKDRRLLTRVNVLINPSPQDNHRGSKTMTVSIPEKFKLGLSVRRNLAKEMEMPSPRFPMSFRNTFTDKSSEHHESREYSIKRKLEFTSDPRSVKATIPDKFKASKIVDFKTSLFSLAEGAEELDQNCTITNNTLSQSSAETIFANFSQTYLKDCDTSSDITMQSLKKFKRDGQGTSQSRSFGRDIALDSPMFSWTETPSEIGSQILMTSPQYKGESDNGTSFIFGTKESLNDFNVSGQSIQCREQLTFDSQKSNDSTSRTQNTKETSMSLESTPAKKGMFPFFAQFPPLKDEKSQERIPASSTTPKPTCEPSQEEVPKPTFRDLRRRMSSDSDTMSDILEIMEASKEKEGLNDGDDDKDSLPSPSLIKTPGQQRTFLMQPQKFRSITSTPTNQERASVDSERSPQTKSQNPSSTAKSQINSASTPKSDEKEIRFEPLSEDSLCMKNTLNAQNQSSSFFVKEFAWCSATTTKSLTNSALTPKSDKTKFRFEPSSNDSSCMENTLNTQNQTPSFDVKGSTWCGGTTKSWIPIKSETPLRSQCLPRVSQITPLVDCSQLGRAPSFTFGSAARAQHSLTPVRMDKSLNSNLSSNGMKITENSINFPQTSTPIKMINQIPSSIKQVTDNELFFNSSPNSRLPSFKKFDNPDSNVVTAFHKYASGSNTENNQSTLIRQSIPTFNAKPKPSTSYLISHDLKSENLSPNVHTSKKEYSKLSQPMNYFDREKGLSGLHALQYAGFNMNMSSTLQDMEMRSEEFTILNNENVSQSSETAIGHQGSFPKAFMATSSTDLFYEDNLLKHLLEQKDEIIKSYNKNKLKLKATAGNDDVLSQPYIKRYKKGGMTIFKLKDRFRQVKNKPAPEETIMERFTQDLDGNGPACADDEGEIVLTPESYITDVSESESLDTDQSTVSDFQTVLREGLDRLCKDKRLIFSKFSDVAPVETDKTTVLTNVQKIILDVLYAFENVHTLCFKSPKVGPSNTIFKDNRNQLSPNLECQTINFRNSRSKFKFILILYLLDQIRFSLESGTKMTKREIYYQLKLHVPQQNATDRAIQFISRMMGVGNWALNIIAHKGLVYGNLKLIMESGETINCNIPGTMIPADVSEVCEFQTDARFILVVEKEAIFNSLLEENLPERLTRSFIIITGKGNPDMSTQRFLKQLWMTMSIPVFILVDADPDGIAIMLTYRFGCMASAHISEQLAIPKAKWIGVFPSEIHKLSLDHESLTTREVDRCKSLLQLDSVMSNEGIRKQLEIMSNNGIKAGIERITRSKNYLSHQYLRMKFHLEDFI